MKKIDYNKYQSPGIIFNDRGEQIDLTNILCVNQKGDVFIYPRNINGRHTKGYFAKPRSAEKGHLQIALTDDYGKKHYIYVHRLVAFAWLHREPYQTDVLHGDDNPLNNDVTNLRWGTAWDNMQDRWARNRNPKYKNRCSDETMLDIFTMGKGRDNMKPRHIHQLFPEMSYDTLYPISTGASVRLQNYLKRNPDKNPLLCSVGLN